jgi:hypothetical protein
MRQYLASEMVEASLRHVVFSLNNEFTMCNDISGNASGSFNNLIAATQAAPRQGAERSSEISQHFRRFHVYVICHLCELHDGGGFDFGHVVFS